MRTITAAQQAVLDSGVQSEHLRVSVKDAGGTWRDLTTYPGFNAVRSVTWGERVDQPHMTCDVSLHREQGHLSLNPLHATSAINKGFDPAASYTALLALTRELKVEVAIAPQDKQPGNPVLSLVTSHYRFENDVVDAKGVSNGTATGVTYAAGKAGQGGVFNGSAYVALTAANFRPTGSFSASVWFKTSTTGVYQELFENYEQNPNPTGFEFRVRDTNVLQLVVGYGGGSYILIDGTTTVTDGNWHHAAFSFDSSAGVYRIFLDGAQQNFATGASSPAFPSTTNARIGVNEYVLGTRAHYFNGTIDEVSYFGAHALSAQDVLSLYNAGSGVPFDDGWFTVFHGRIDDYDAASGYDIRLGCRSLGGRLAQQYIKTELVYSFAAVAGVAIPLRIWEPQIPVVLNTTYVLPASRAASDPGYQKFLKCSQSGTTGTAEPVWTTGTNQVDGSARWDYTGSTSSGGNPVEQIMQNILNDHKASGDPTVTLYVPASPSWAIRQFTQQREFVLDALLSLAKQIGWDLRYKWRASSSQFELTLYQPNRASPSVAHTFSTDDYEDPTRLAVNIANIRNSWRLVYSDRADLWPDGQPKRKVIEVSDSASIAKYGELWAEIQEGDASQIDTSTEATALVNAALSDCKEPTAELSVALTRGFPWVELNDYYTFTANGRHFTNYQSLAVTGWSQSFDSGRLRTTLELRGAPTIGSTAWLLSSVHPTRQRRAVPPGLSRFEGTTTPLTTLDTGVGGLIVKTRLANRDKSREALRDSEVHVYESAGVALTASTLRGVVGPDAALSVPDLIPGKTYYVRTVPRSYSEGQLVRGQPSTETSAVAGRANAAHLSVGVEWGRVPLNGGFETWNEAGNLPDHWAMGAGSWGNDFTRGVGSAAASGDQYLILSCDAFSADAIFTRDYFAVTEGRAYFAEWIVQIVSSTSHATVGFTVQWFAYDFSYVSYTAIDSVAGDAFATGAWNRRGLHVVAPSTAKFAKLIISTAGAGDTVFYFDSVRLVDDGDDWVPVTFNAGSTGPFMDYNTTTHQPCAYRKDANGLIHLRGFFTGDVGDLLVEVFTLPVGYRPAKSTNFAVVAGGQFARVEVTTGGVVQVVTADSATWNDHISLDGITFDTR